MGLHLKIKQQQHGSMADTSVGGVDKNYFVTLSMLFLFKTDNVLVIHIMPRYWNGVDETVPLVDINLQGLGEYDYLIMLIDNR